MMYDDLLSVPYRANGRDMDGMDCYGVVLECCRRNGTPLTDICYTDNVPAEQLTDYVSHVNVRKIDAPKRGALVQCRYNGNLHIGFLLDNKTVLHATYGGVRVSPLLVLDDCSFFEVTHDC